jgi:hypothetical protein
MQPRSHGFPPEADMPIWLFPDDSALKAHPFYREAKAGDVTAAVRLVSDLALPFLIQNRHRLPQEACYVAPHAREATGDNAIPQVLAQACAMLSGGKADDDIVQISRVFHTGADPMERMASRAAFEGLVKPDAIHILVDDVTTMGGTLAELADFIQIRGGIVGGAVVIVNAGRAKNLCPSKEVVRKIEKRFSHELEEIVGIQAKALTANEANYLIGFRTADEVRNRLAKARQETNLRLRSKGLERQD